MNPYLILPTLKSYLLGKIKLNPKNHYILHNPKELCKALEYQNITIQYHPKNEKEKKLLIEMINFLNLNGKEVTVTEFSRIFDDEFINRISKSEF